MSFAASFCRSRAPTPRLLYFVTLFVPLLCYADLFNDFSDVQWPAD